MRQRCRTMAGCPAKRQKMCSALLAAVMPGHFVAFPAVCSEMFAQVFGVDVGLGAAADSAGNGMDAIDAGNGMMHKEYSFYNDSNEKTETHTHTQ